MRIAIAQDFLRVGGTERQTVALAHAFAAAGHEVLVLTFRPGGPLAAQLGERVQHRSLQPRDFHADWFAPAFVGTLQRFKPDIVQLMGRMANAYGWRLTRTLPGASIVATFRTGKTIPRLYRLTMRRADAVVANSAYVVQRLARECKIAGPRVHLIRNAMATPATSPSFPPEEARRECGTPANAIVLLCAAMMHPGKGHEDLIAATANLETAAPWELWLAGDGPERESLQQLAGKICPAHGRIRFLGTRFDMERLYTAGDIAVLASQPSRESLPNFLVEAQWHGVPVVAYDAAGLREAFVPDVSGLLVPLNDREGLARAIAQLADDTARRARMSEAARAFARREFDPQQQNERYLELYALLRSQRSATEPQQKQGSVF